jgi:tagatose 1,6-diphosphate aldolase GatY/KbaY
VIADLRGLLGHARRARTAIAAFSCYDAETAVAVLRVADGRPVVVLVPAALVLEPHGELVVAALRAMAERTPGPVCLQLDHAHGLEEVEAACDWGVNAVMVDGSRLSLEANVELVHAARSITSRGHVALEAALGRLAGDEEVATAVGVDSDGLTEPADVRAFVRDARPDCLAVAVGNAHGMYRDPPSLRASRSRAIAACADLPLVLHGGSGLPAPAIQDAVAAGIAKVNFNTELRQAYLEATLGGLAAAMDGARSLHLHRRQVDAVAEVAAEKLAAVCR